MRVFALLGALLALLALPLPAAGEEDPDATERQAARAAVLVPWSRDAQTTTLGLSAPATEFLDLWLDFCRSKHAKRTKESEAFQGVPHAEWEGAPEALIFRAAFVNLELAHAELAQADAPALFDAIVSDGFVAAARVAGDEDRWLRLWGVMLVTEVADRQAGVWSGDAFVQARERVLDHLLETLAATAAFGDGTVRLGSLASERLVWLLGIRSTGCDQAGAILTEVCTALRSRGAEKCVRATSAILAGCPGPEAEAFVLTELTSGDWERQRTVLAGAGRYATPALLERVATLVRELDSDERAQMAFVVLQRAAAKGGLHRPDAIATLKRLLADLPDGSERKTLAAMALVQSENASPQVVALLRALVTRLEKEDAHPGRVKFLQRVIERAEAQIAAEAAEEAVEEDGPDGAG